MPPRRIFKYQLPIEVACFDLELAAWQLLAVQVQDGVPCLWADVYTGPTAIKRRRTFRWIPTGGHVDERPMVYLGTVQLNQGHVVLHLYEVLV